MKLSNTQSRNTFFPLHEVCNCNGKEIPSPTSIEKECCLATVAITSGID
jgi:hypothetical protein